MLRLGDLNRVQEQAAAFPFSDREVAARILRAVTAGDPRPDRDGLNAAQFRSLLDVDEPIPAGDAHQHLREHKSTPDG